MKFGIYLAPPPEQPLINQGLSRLLSFLIKGALKSGKVELIIAAPHWSLRDIYELLEDHRISRTAVQFLTTPGDPLWLRIKRFIEKNKQSRSSLILWINKGKRWLERSSAKTLVWFLSSNSIIEGCMKLPLFGIAQMALLGIGSLAALVLTPPLFLILIIKISLKIGKQANKLTHDVPVFGNTVRIFGFLVQAAIGPARVFRQNIMAHRIFQFLRDYETKKVVALVNKRTDISVWFVPTMFWKEIEGIRSKKVVAAADFVQIDFPLQYRPNWARIPFDNCSETIRCADGLICYSEYVKREHLIKRFGIPNERIHVVYNGPVDLSIYLEEPIIDGKAHNQQQSAIYLIKKYQEKVCKNDAYLANFDFTSIRYLFFASQARHHKNIRNLILAYEKLLRSNHINIKLFLTANLKFMPELQELIEERRLHRDVICFYEVPSAVLAALNHLSLVALTPTLFEGGFPIFTFTEAYSVGTPCLMARSPIVLERFPLDDRKLEIRTLFDPYDINDIAEHIWWAVENRQELYEMQQPFYKFLTSRGWDQVALEYLGVMQKVVDGENSERDCASNASALGVFDPKAQ